MNDLDLLRKFEPIVKFTQGEMFFPCAVDEYVKRCSLWVGGPNNYEEELVPEGELTVEKLAQFTESRTGYTLYLRYVETPLEPLEYQRWRRRPDRPVFNAPGRLTRVGLVSRLLDSLFDLSLAVRGTVPGGTTAVAEIKYRDILSNDPRYVYYGRVVREGGYIILHYLFFYTMNNWRSSFYGVNDHEADWEQIFIYLSDEGDAEPVPQWLAYASHDFFGDDLRRRWDDPELHIIDNCHPIVFAGAGSHASYFLPGEYLMGIEPEFLIPVKNFVLALRKFWVDKLGQGRSNESEEEQEEHVGALLSIPFIDYARGDGVKIGPGQEKNWSPVIMSEEMGWIENYRGLWGLDTQDPFGGERAPAGPKYNRDGSVRMAWYDPLGWSGLDKVLPPRLVIAQLEENITSLEQERQAIEQEIELQRETLRLLNLEVRSLREESYLKELYETKSEELDEAQANLQSLFARHTQIIEISKASKAHLKKVQAGNWGNPQAHIKHKHPPEPPLGPQARLTEIWAAISGGMLLLAFTVLLMTSPEQWLTWTILIAFIFATVEATARGKLANFLLNLTIVLAVITTILLIIDFWWLILIFIMFVLVIAMIFGNLRELWSSK